MNALPTLKLLFFRSLDRRGLSSIITPADMVGYPQTDIAPTLRSYPVDNADFSLEVGTGEFQLKGGLYDNVRFYKSVEVGIVEGVDVALERIWAFFPPGDHLGPALYPFRSRIRAAQNVPRTYVNTSALSAIWGRLSGEQEGMVFTGAIYALLSKAYTDSSPFDVPFLRPYHPDALTFGKVHEQLITVLRAKLAADGFSTYSSDPIADVFGGLFPGFDREVLRASLYSAQSTFFTTPQKIASMTCKAGGFELNMPIHDLSAQLKSDSYTCKINPYGSDTLIEILDKLSITDFAFDFTIHDDAYAGGQSVNWASDRYGGAVSRSGDPVDRLKLNAIVADIIDLLRHHWPHGDISLEGATVQVEFETSFSEDALLTYYVRSSTMKPIRFYFDLAALAISSPTAHRRRL